MLSEEDSNFKDKYKTIYSFSLTFEALEVKKDADVTEDVFNIYISGIDSYGSVNSLTRSDVNIVASINPKTNQILLINIPRDYYVEFPGTSKKDKLTHAGIYGIDMSINTVEELLDIEINYYFKVNYNALIKLVDALGGVDVYSKYTFTSGEYYFKYQKGYNHVNGIQALEFVRTRKAFKDGDRVRGENQQAMIKAIIKKAISPSILTKYSDILNSLKGTFATNMGIETITDLIKLQLDKMPSWNIVSKSLNGSDGSGFTYTYPHQELYVMIPNQQTIDDIKQEIEKNMQDEVLDASIEETSDKVNTPTVNKPVVETKEEVDSNNDESFTEKEPVVLDENINQNDNPSIDNDKGTNEDDIESNLTE